MWTVGGGDRSTNVLIGIRTALTPFSVKKTGLSMLSSLANDCRRQSIHSSSSLVSKHQDVNGENAQLEVQNRISVTSE